MDSLDAEPSAPRDAVASALAVATSPILLTGVYAWGVTVAPTFSLALSHITQGAMTTRAVVAMISSVLALGPLLVGVVFERRGAAFAPWIGVWGFLACCLLTWLALPAAVDVARVDGLRGALGGAGFGLFALAWGVPDVFRRLVPEDDPRADTSLALDARDRLPRAVLPLAAVGIASAAALAFFAWQVHDVPRGLLAHSLAGLSAVAVVSAAAQVAVGRRAYVAPSPRTRLRRARAAIALLAGLAALGLTYALLSR